MKGISFNQKEKVLVGVLLLSLIGTSLIAGYLFTQYATVKGQYETLQNEYNTLQNRLNTLNLKEQELKEELKTATENEIPDLEKELAQIQEEKAKLKERIKALEDELERFKNLYVRGFKLTDLYWETGYRDWTEEGSFKGRANVIKFTAGDYDCQIWTNFRDSTYGEIIFDLNHNYPTEIRSIQIVFKSGDDVAFVISDNVEKDKWQRYKIEFNCRHSKFSFYKDGYTVLYNSTFQNDVDSIDTIEINTRLHKDYRMAIDLQHLEAFHIDPTAEPNI